MPRILLVDDEEPLRRTLGAFLRMQAHEVHEAAADAVEAFDRVQPDLVICDLIMPVVDGLTVIHNIRLRSPRVPVIALTGCPDLAGLARMAGATAVLSKLASLTDLTDHIEALGAAAGRHQASRH
ncbi:MAG TPA: response regulator [Azospirillaceae bacterium]|nr:response regulator [Azospirillaceae bacterium]